MCAAKSAKGTLDGPINKRYLVECSANISIEMPKQMNKEEKTTTRGKGRREEGRITITIRDKSMSNDSNARGCNASPKFSEGSS